MSGGSAATSRLFDLFWICYRRFSMTDWREYKVGVKPESSNGAIAMGQCITRVDRPPSATQLRSETV